MFVSFQKQKKEQKFAEKKKVIVIKALMINKF